MASLIDSIDGIKTIEDGLVANKVAKFSYTQCAYDTNDVNGVSEYNYQCEQNIPLPDASTLKVNETTLNKGYRSQASSITRMLLNHFFGRVSYNLNKLNDNFSSLLTALKSYIGRANGVASLDENGRIPYSQLPETAQELRGTWNASTNVWTGYDGATGSLISGTGDIGDTYIVTTEGWFNSATGQSSSTPVAGYEHYLVNGRIMYNGTDWVNISGSSHYALCNESYFRAGEGSSASSYSVVIGSNARSVSSYGVGIGAFAQVNCGVAIGRQAMTDKGVSIGTCALGSSGVAIGIDTNAGTGVAIGCKATGSDGVSIGNNACSGIESVAIGTNTLRCLESGSQNTAIGMNAGCSVTTGSNITAIGYNALRNATVGSDHTAIGASALSSLTTGLYNTAIGARALCGLTTGCENFGLGINAGWAITTGCNNVVIGNNTAQAIAGDSSENVVIGKNAMCLSCNCTVYRTVIIGSNAGVRNRANNNVFVGQGSGYNNTTGGGNVFLGLDSGSTNTTGESNTFVGLSSGKCNTTGSYNTYVGGTAGSQNVGSDNTFIGGGAGSGETNRSHSVIVGNITKISSDRAFAIGYEDPAGSCNNYIFTCNGEIYWCFGSLRFTIQTTYNP